jgi:hypothetical protein
VRDCPNHGCDAPITFIVAWDDGMARYCGVHGAVQITSLEDGLPGIRSVYVVQEVKFA